jgi:predicted phage-related endonuclease
MSLRRHTAPQSPLEQAGPTMAAIRQAEEAAAARLAAQQADQADLDAARRQAAERLAAASRRAQQLAEQRRKAVRAEFDAEIQREQAAGAAKIERITQAARDSHDLAVQLAVTFVLTGEAA